MLSEILNTGENGIHGEKPALTVRRAALGIYSRLGRRHSVALQQLRLRTKRRGGVVLPTGVQFDQFVRRRL